MKPLLYKQEHSGIAALDNMKPSVFLIIYNFQNGSTFLNIQHVMLKLKITSCLFCDSKKCLIEVLMVLLRSVLKKLVVVFKFIEIHSILKLWPNIMN